jgi:hypothetical protein
VRSGEVFVQLSLESGGRFCIGAFGRNQASVVYAFNLLSKEVYKLSTSMLFAKIMLQYAALPITQRRLLPVNFNGSYYASIAIRYDGK